MEKAQSLDPELFWIIALLFITNFLTLGKLLDFSEPIFLSGKSIAYPLGA